MDKKKYMRLHRGAWRMEWTLLGITFFVICVHSKNFDPFPVVEVPLSVRERSFQKSIDLGNDAEDEGLHAHTHRTRRTSR